MFLCLETASLDTNLLQCLSTRLMHWMDDVWLIDLRDFLSFWQIRARKQSVSLENLFLQILNDALPVVDSDEALSSTTFRAALGDHPWKSVMLWAYMKERDLHGLLSTHSGFGKNLHHKISWKTWWYHLGICGNHFEKAGFKGFRNGEFQKSMALWQRSIKRLGLHRVEQLISFNTAGIKRRFGESLAQIWVWSFEEQPSWIYQEFPWTLYEFQKIFSVERVLDYSVILWEQIENILQEDFQRLIRMLESHTVRITEIEWILRLDDMREIVIPIHFRHPYDMHGESPHFKVALLQAEYNFYAHAYDLLPQSFSELLRSETDVQPLVVGWRLSIIKYMQIHYKLRDLFEQTASDSLSDLEQLDNELCVPMLRYDFIENWIPELSFQPVCFSWENPAADDFAFTSLLANRTRPLLMKKNQEHMASDQASTTNFLESLSTPWWLGEKSYQRHYYQMIDQTGRAHWIYKNEKGEMICHGIFA